MKIARFWAQKWARICQNECALWAALTKALSKSRESPFKLLCSTDLLCIRLRRIRRWKKAILRENYVCVERARDFVCENLMAPSLTHRKSQCSRQCLPGIIRLDILRHPVHDDMNQDFLIHQCKQIFVYWLFRCCLDKILWNHCE